MTECVDCGHNLNYLLDTTSIIYLNGYDPSGKTNGIILFFQFSLSFDRTDFSSTNSFALRFVQ
jgi:hypothetical protein